jgi:hypothetical protein
MTKGDIMKLALESGFAKILDEHASEYRNFTFELSQDHYPELERFIDLIAAHKTEVALAEAYRCGHEAGAVAEREACAKLCEAQGEYGWQQYADAIRARGTA